MVALQLRSLLAEAYQAQPHSLCCVALLAMAPGWQAHGAALLQEGLKAFPAKVGAGWAVMCAWADACCCVHCAWDVCSLGFLLPGRQAWYVHV
jgi:hypothetical protein